MLNKNHWAQVPDPIYLFTHRIFGLLDFRQPVYMVRDPELLRQIAIKDFDHFEDHKMGANNSNDMLSDSLVMLRGDKWRDMRATLSPAFTGSKMRQMFELIGECAYGICEHFKKHAKAGVTIEPEMKDLFLKYTNDVIATSAFGISVNSFENPKNEFYVTGKRMLNMTTIRFTIKAICMRIVPAVMKALKFTTFDAPSENFFKTLVTEAMDIREKQNIFRPDMINLLMQVRQGKQITTKDLKETIDTDGFATVEESAIGRAITKRKWTDHELVAQSFLFFIAALNASSTLLSFTTYEFALNPDIQEKLYEEIRELNEKLKGERLLYDHLQNMKYMDMVISEMLRKWPPALYTDRMCVKDYEVNDGGKRFVIEKGTSVWLPIYPIHRDSNYYPNPDKFDPERFNDENKGSIKPGTYIPFGIGPRNCIGIFCQTT